MRRSTARRACPGGEIQPVSALPSETEWPRPPAARAISSGCGSDEEERLRALQDLGLLDGPPDPALATLTSALRMILDVPLAFVTIIDAKRAWVRAASGCHEPHHPAREDTFCDLVVRGQAPVVIEDAAADQRCAGNRYVTAQPGYRFYVGVPLTTSGGVTLGALCGFDYVPRRAPAPYCIDTLRGLATAVVSKIELRTSERALRGKEEALRKQSDLLQTILDSVDQGITAFDHDRRLVAWNRRAADLMDLPAREFAPGADATTFAPLSVAIDRLGARPLRAAQQADRWFEPFRHETVTATGRVVELSAAPLAGGGLLAMHTDVSEERRRAAELTDQARRFAIQERISSIANKASHLHEALAALLDAVCDHSLMPAGRVRRLTDGALLHLAIERSGLTTEEPGFLPPLAFDNAARHVARTGSSFRGEVPPAWGRAGRPPLAVYAFPIQILSDVYVFECYGTTQLAFRDWHVLVRGHIETQFSRVAQRERVERLKSEFVSTVSHELQTPLTPVLGMLELLDAGIFGPVPAEAKDAIAIAYQNSRRLSRIVEDVLELEALRTGRATLDLKTQLLHPLIAAAVAPFADRRAIAIVTNPGCEGLEAVVDGPSLTEILSRLLSNALKFSSAEITLRIFRRPGGGIRISVIDRGPGIAPDFRARLYEQFAQADGSDRRRADGAGLGLAIVKALTDLLGVSISFETCASEGTTFHLDFAAATSAKPST